jgi:hypothetical protein
MKNNYGTAAAVFFIGIIVILTVAYCKGQKEVPDERPRPTHSVRAR